MRTTLKRGIGRSATTNGNGRVVLPPAIAEPVRRYRQPKVERGFLYYLSWTIAWLIVSILTVAVGLAGGVYLLYHETLHDVQAHTPELKIAQERLGHSTIAITLDLYSHVTETMQEDAAARIDAAFRGAKIRY